MLGWEFPPFMAGGLGIHCHELTSSMAAEGVSIDFYMPHMRDIQGDHKVAEHHDHLSITEVEADTPVDPYGGDRRARYDANFNAAVMQYNRRLVDAFHSHDADVIHCHDWITVPAAMELRRRTGIPLVFTVHSTEYDRSAGFYPQTWIEDIEREGVQAADRVIAVSRYTKDLVVRLYGADPARVEAVHNGIDVAKFTERRVRRHGASERDTVLFLSRLTRQKSPLSFLRAARRVLDRRPQTSFVVAGKGDMLGECIEYVYDHGMGDRVKFTGYIPDEDLPSFYASNEIYVLPSFSEPFGISVLEAMATGLPTIVSRTSGVGEALQHAFKADHWDTEEMADLMLALLDSPELRQEMGQNGAREAARFRWSDTTRKTLDVYRSAIEGPMPTPLIKVTS